MPHTTGQKITESISLALLVSVYIFQVIFNKILTSCILLLSYYKGYRAIAYILIAFSSLTFLPILFLLVLSFRRIEKYLNDDEMEGRVHLLNIEIMHYKQPMQKESSMLKLYRN